MRQGKGPYAPTPFLDSFLSSLAIFVATSFRLGLVCHGQSRRCAASGGVHAWLLSHRSSFWCLLSPASCHRVSSRATAAIRAVASALAWAGVLRIVPVLRVSILLFSVTISTVQVISLTSRSEGEYPIMLFAGQSRRAQGHRQAVRYRRTTRACSTVNSFSRTFWNVLVEPFPTHEPEPALRAIQR